VRAVATALATFAVAIDTVKEGRETAYLLRVRRGFTLELVRTVLGPKLSPDIFAK
jgi:hypothetical protein